MYCSPIEMITVYTCYYREKLRLPVLKSFQPIINLVFEFNNTIESSLRILYLTSNFTDMLFEKVHMCLKKNQNASRPSEHLLVRGKNVKTFTWDHRLQIQTSPWHLHGLLDGSNIGSTANTG